MAVATISLTNLITSISGSVKTGAWSYFDWKRVIFLGLPAVVTAQIGVYIVNQNFALYAAFYF